MSPFLVVYFWRMAINRSNIKQFLMDTKVSEVMATPVIVVKQTDDFSVVHEKLSLFYMRHLPVVDDAGRIVGIITLRDLYQIHSPRRLEDGSWYYDKEELNEFVLMKVMISDPFTLKPENSLFDAIDATIRYKYGCVPIIDNFKKPCGIVTRHTILKYLSGQS